MKNKLIIKKIRLVGKWAELWLDGMPYEKQSKWDEHTNSLVETNELAYNYSCKSYMLEKLLTNESDIQDIIGYEIELNEIDHPSKIIKPLTNMETNEKLSDLSLSDLVSLFNYIDYEADHLDKYHRSLKTNEVEGNCAEKILNTEMKLDMVREELIVLQAEIEKRRGNLFIH